MSHTTAAEISSNQYTQLGFALSTHPASPRLDATATAKSLETYLGPRHAQSAELQGLQARPRTRNDK